MPRLDPPSSTGPGCTFFSSSTPKYHFGTYCLECTRRCDSLPNVDVSSVQSTQKLPRTLKSSPTGTSVTFLRLPCRTASPSMLSLTFPVTLKCSLCCPNLHTLATPGAFYTSPIPILGTRAGNQSCLALLGQILQEQWKRRPRGIHFPNLSTSHCPVLGSTAPPSYHFFSPPIV